jgi:DNA polymerase II large subunit
MTYQDWETKWFRGRRLADPRAIFEEAIQIYNSMQEPQEQKMDYTQDQDENGKPLNAFGEILRVMTVEHLIRFRRRLEKVGRKRMVEILTDEIVEREQVEKAAAAQAQIQQQAQAIAGGKLPKGGRMTQ